MSDPITTYYSDTPSEVLDQNQRVWYDPMVSEQFRAQSVFYGMIPFNMKNLGAYDTTQMVITEILDAHPNFDPILFRAAWAGASHFDSRRRVVTFERYGGKLALDKSSELITYWRQGGAARNTVLRRLIEGQLGNMIVQVNDILIRNAFLSNSTYTNYQGTATDLAGIGTGDTFDLGVLEDAWLRMGYSNRVPMAVDPSLPMNNRGTLLCVTSPGVVNTIQSTVSDGSLNSSNPWISSRQYSNEMQDLVANYEVGMWKNTRFIQTPRMTLFNCGEVIGQVQLGGAHTAGDGAPDPSTTTVDGVWYTGQQSSGITNYIQLESSGVATLGAEAGDMISIHTDRTADGRADYTDGTKEDRIVASVDSDTDRITLKTPIMLDHAATAYVTLARHIHTAVIMGGPDGVVSGVIQPPRVYNPPWIDDFAMVHRFTFDQYMGYQLWDPEVYDVWAGAAKVRFTGAAGAVQ